MRDLTVRTPGKKLARAGLTQAGKNTVPNVVFKIFRIDHYTGHNCHTFFLKKLQKSVTIWENLPKRYYFWTIIKQQKV